MNTLVKALALIALLADVSGCTAAGRQPECHGPWTPINPPQQARAHD